MSAIRQAPCINNRFCVCTDVNQTTPFLRHEQRTVNIGLEHAKRIAGRFSLFMGIAMTAWGANLRGQMQIRPLNSYKSIFILSGGIP